MRRRSTVMVTAALATMMALSVSHAGPLDPNPWLNDIVLNIAHQGGEIEAPSNTLYALKRAKALGVDVLEVDVHATADGKIVVLHDATVNRTTNGQGRVDAFLLEEIRALDAAYWFIQDEGTVHDPNRDSADFTFRGVATGDKPPPPGYKDTDFRIPTLREVLQEFDDIPINIEIKATAPVTLPYEKLLADLLAEFGRDDDVIVVSFHDQAMEAFKALAPNVHTATATGQTALFWASARGPGAPNPRYVALQVPITFNGVQVVDAAFVQKANANGLAVHVWTINSKAEMCHLIGLGVQGIMTDKPTLLQSILDGSDPC